MKFWSPTPDHIKYTYTNFTYTGGLIHTSININDTDFNSLARKTALFLEQGKDIEAIQYSGRLAIEYGIPGLVVYIDTNISILAKESNKNEIIEQEVIKLLAYLYFAKEMLLDKKEANALKSMDMVYSDDEYQFKTYWTERTEKLYSLAGKNLELVKSEAQDIASVLVEDCYNEAKKSDSIEKKL